MKSSRELALEYLPQGQLMQLATVHDSKPWICTVHYVFYSHNLYWLSLPERRHSKEIAANENVAAAVAIKADKPVIGLQIEGSAAPISGLEEIKAVMQLYSEKYKGSGAQFYDAFKAGKNQHQLYRLIPQTIVLFDEVHFPNDGRQVVTL